MYDDDDVGDKIYERRLWYLTSDDEGGVAAAECRRVEPDVTLIETLILVAHARHVERMIEKLQRLDRQRVTMTGQRPPVCQQAAAANVDHHGGTAAHHIRVLETGI